MGRLIMALAVMLSFAVMPAEAKKRKYRPAKVEARIDISSQRMNVYERGRLRYSWKISTARRGYRTPVGNFRPTRMHKMWHSRKYNMSPMPHSIFFYGGYAIHGTNAIKRLGRPASHGCIRLHPANARKLYSMVRRNGARNARIRIRY